ncbi:MAG: hypothetical protein IJ722_02725 [Alloprevotella sp.]|nr:hypothetical protein [Alloprevotella sp.]
MSGSYGFNFTIENTTTYTWNADGNITKAVFTYQSSMDQQPATRTTTYQYGNVENPLRQQLVLAGMNSANAFSPLYTLGFFGAGPAHLPTQITSNGDTWSYTVTLRPDGLIAKEDIGGWLIYEPVHDTSASYDLNQDGSVDVGDITVLVARALGQ